MNLNIMKDIIDVTSENLNPGLIETLFEKLVSFLPTIFLAILIFIIGTLLNKIVLKILTRGLKKSKLDKTVHGFLRSMVRVVLYAFTLIITLSILQIPMSSIIAVIGAAGLAVGLALQDSLSNIAGGFILLFAKPFKVGDYIEVNGISGVVDDITILSTKITTADNKVIFIQNGTVSSATIVNYTQEERRRVDFSFGISYDNDFRKAITIIQNVVDKHNLILKEPEPTIRLNELAQSSMNIITRVWVNSNDYWTVYYDIIEQVKLEFDMNDIIIPYNQLDVHVVSEKKQ